MRRGPHLRKRTRISISPEPLITHSHSNHSNKSNNHSDSNAQSHNHSIYSHQSSKHNNIGTHKNRRDIHMRSQNYDKCDKYEDYRHEYRVNNRKSSGKSSGKYSNKSSRRNSNAQRAESNIIVHNDDKGHLEWKKCDNLNERYQIKNLLGEGTFGRAFKCKDLYHNENVAIKVVRNVQKYRESAMIEIDIIKSIHKSTSNQKILCINLLNWFNYGGHVCLVFPLLGKSVFDFIKKNDYQPFTFNQIKHISYQLFSSLEFLHNQKLTHTDLKPENILFVNSDYEEFLTTNGKKYNNILNTDIRIIDFGSAVFEEEHHGKVVCTRHYRPPEVVLELGWSYPCDMWSVGCIIYELYKGKALFMTHDNHEHLVMCELVLGTIPQFMIEKTSKQKYFQNGKLLHVGKNVEKEYVYNNCVPLKKSFILDDKLHVQLYQIVRSLLCYDPKKRLTASEGCVDPLFTNIFCSWNESV